MPIHIQIPPNKLKRQCPHTYNWLIINYSLLSYSSNSSSPVDTTDSSSTTGNNHSELLVANRPSNETKLDHLLAQRKWEHQLQKSKKYTNDLFFYWKIFNRLINNVDFINFGWNFHFKNSTKNFRIFFLINFTFWKIFIFW